MIAKLIAGNQIVLPEPITDQLGLVEYFEVEIQNGRIVLTPKRNRRADAARAKLAELNLTGETIRAAVIWARDGTHRTHNDEPR